MPGVTMDCGASWRGLSAGWKALTPRPLPQASSVVAEMRLLVACGRGRGGVVVGVALGIVGYRSIWKYALWNGDGSTFAEAAVIEAVADRAAPARRGVGGVWGGGWGPGLGPGAGRAGLGGRNGDVG